MALLVTTVHQWPSHSPLPESGVKEFGEWICKEDWADIISDDNPTRQVKIFEDKVKQKVDVSFPTKSVKINPHRDLPFISAELKKLDRQIKREYRKHNKSIKYQNLKKTYDDKFKCTASQYLDRSVRSLMEDDPGTVYRCLKRLSAQPGDHQDDGVLS